MIETLLSQKGPMTAFEIARSLQKPLEEVYERLVHLESEGIAVLTYIPGGRKFRACSPRYQWVMA